MYAPLLGFGKATDVPHEEIYLIHMMSVFFEAAESSKPQHQYFVKLPPILTLDLVLAFIAI